MVDIQGIKKKELHIAWDTDDKCLDVWISGPVQWKWKTKYFYFVHVLISFLLINIFFILNLPPPYYYYYYLGRDRSKTGPGK